MYHPIDTNAVRFILFRERKDEIEIEIIKMNGQRSQTSAQGILN